MICRQCKASIPNGSRFCEFCGNPVEADRPAPPEPNLVCPGCNTTVMQKSRFCETCGYRLEITPTAPPGVSPPVPHPHSEHNNRDQYSQPRSTDHTKKPEQITRTDARNKRSISNTTIVITAIIGLVLIIFAAWLWYNMRVSPQGDAVTVTQQESAYVYEAGTTQSPDIPSRADDITDRYTGVNERESALKAAYNRYVQAFNYYTELVTTGGESDIADAQAGYQKAYNEYNRMFWMTPPDAAVLLFDNVKTDEIARGAASPPHIFLKGRTRITYIETLHAADGGSQPGTIRLRRIDPADRLTYGPWQAQIITNDYNRNEVIWMARPDELLAQGTYEIIVSDPAAWLHNSGSRLWGFARVRGIYYDLD